MALPQLYPGSKLIKLRSCAAKDFEILNYGRRTQPSFLLRGSIDSHWTKLSSICSCEVRSWLLLQSWGHKRIRSRSVARNASNENMEHTMKETPTSSPGVDGQLKESSQKPNLDPPLGTTIFLFSAYTFLALSFVPPQLLGPFGILYAAQKVIQYCAYFTLFLHVLEISYAVYLSSKVDPDNVLRWAALAAFYGLLALKHLAAKTSVRKLD